MNRVKISKDEQETTIVIDPLTKKATVYSCIPSMVKKLETLSSESKVEVIGTDRYGISVSLPAQWIKIIKPQKREYTDEQRSALRERLEKARMMKKEKGLLSNQ